MLIVMSAASYRLWSLVAALQVAHRPTDKTAGRQAEAFSDVSFCDTLAPYYGVRNGFVNPPPARKEKKPPTLSDGFLTAFARISSNRWRKTMQKKMDRYTILQYRNAVPPPGGLSTTRYKA